MKKGIILKKRKFMKITSVVTILLATLILISSSSISLTLKNKTDNKNIYFEDFNKEVSNGLAPRNRYNLDKSRTILNDKLAFEISPICEIMYGYCACDPYGEIEEGPVYFCLEDPGIIDQIAPTQSENFIAGATCTLYSLWIGSEYGNGRLWEIDIDTGEMTSIGGGGVNIDGFAYNPCWNRFYGSSDNNYLYEIDPDTGEQEQIGPFGNDVDCMIGLAFDLEGILYGWDLGCDKLWIIDTETGEATEVGPLGIDLNYAQDGFFCWETDILWLTAYTTMGQLYYCDKETGECVLIDNFENGAQITGSIFDECYWGPEHDVGLYSIDYPESGYAIPEVPMQVTVKNHGNSTETTDVQMQVTKYEAGPVIMEEDFSGVFPPEGWETDYWNISNTNISGGASPEARIYNYDQYNGSQYYDNYIMSKSINCSGLEKVNLKFRWAGDYKYPQYVSVYVNFRRNSTSPWRDVTPWENPVGSNQVAKLWETSCYCIDNPMGEGFQIKWEYTGYYYYFNYLWLDDIEIIAYNFSEEYDKTVEDIEIKYGETVTVEFPSWTPNDWQDPLYENTWQEYKVKACTLLKDHKPSNDCKNKLIDLYFPWFHDIEVKSIDSPYEDGPGKTYPVQATIKNVGQNAECCIPIEISIGEQIELETFLNEKAWETVPPEGWYDEHKDFDPEYGWKKSYTSKSGGFSPEASLPYYNAKSDHVMYSYAIDTSSYDTLILRFKTYINHYSGQGLYALEAGYSYDIETWYAAWHEEPGSSGCYEVDVPIEGGSETTYIGFWVKGNPYYFNYWYIDDVELAVMSFNEEYSDYACQGPDLQPGEEANFTFDDWTPDFLQNETSGKKDYVIKCSVEMEGDKNLDNDIKTEMFRLYYWHDVGIDRVTSPVGEGYPRKEYEILWDNGDPDGRNALQGSMYQGYSNLLIDDFQAEEDWTIYYGIIHFIWDSGYSPGNLDKLRFYIFETLDYCEPYKEEYPEEGYYVEANTFNEYTTGNYYFGRPEIIVEFELDEGFEIPAGSYYVGIQPDGVIDDIAYLLTSESKGCMVMADLPYWGHPRWTSSQEIWDEQYDLAWKLTWYGCLPPTRAWIKPGTQDIDAVVKNYGTFPKKDLNCYAEIREYITDPENGTQVYTDEIGNIDLIDPLGGEEELQFKDFTFTDEGRYSLFLNLPTSPDEKLKNNKITWRIGVDDTNPDSDYPPILDPPEPTGNNGWYVDNIEVTLNASDPYSNSVSSGVKEIRYTINGGYEHIINGSTGSFILTEEGKNILIEYWAVDNAGNVETPKNECSVKLDKTSPDVSLDYEVTGGNPLTGWKLTFTATATDIMSGMEKVEFYFNDYFQETVTGPGPTYQWTYTYYGDVKMIIKAIAYDKAGNSDSDQIKDPKVCSYSNQKSNQMHSRSFKILKLPHIR